MHDPELIPIETKLDRWAEWITKDAHGLGFPRETTLSRMSQHGMPIRGTRRWEMEILAGHEDEWAVEQAISEMPEPIREPLKHSYLGRGDDKQKARDLELSVRTFYDRVRLAKYWLMGRFQRGVSSKTLKNMCAQTIN
jgi:hypothetical protein